MTLTKSFKIAWKTVLKASAQYVIYSYQEHYNTNWLQKPREWVVWLKGQGGDGGRGVIEDGKLFIVQFWSLLIRKFILRGQLVGS